MADSGNMTRYNRNYSSSDQVSYSYSYGDYYTICPPANFILPPNNKKFKEWNSNQNGSGTSKNPGDTISEGSIWYAIWEDLPTSYKILEDDLIAVADAINAINKNIGKLTWPNDFIEGITKIHFTISTNNYNCIADRGMTWQEWVNSTYNTYGIYISGTNVYLPEYPYNNLYVTSRYTQVNSADLILANFDYMREPGPT